MIEQAHQRLSIAAQCRLLSISRSSYDYAPVPESEETLRLMRGAVAEQLAEVYPQFAAKLFGVKAAATVA